MDLKHVLSTNLRKIRNERGYTQEEMADRLGISLRYLGSIERAKVSPSVTRLGQFADSLNIRPCDLIREVERKK